MANDIVFLESIAKFVLFLHLAFATVLIGVATHNGIIAWNHLRGDLRKIRLQKLYSKVILWFFALTFFFGLIVYPAFRVYVRAYYLDTEVPLATGFFEVKEHWLGLSVGLLALYYPLSRTLDLRAKTAETLPYHITGVTMMVVVWFSVIVGSVLVMFKSV